MRSDSRLFLENPGSFNDVVDGEHRPRCQDAIRQKTTTLVQPVATEATRLAQQGQRGTLITRDYLGHETLQAYAPVDIPGCTGPWSPPSTHPRHSPPSRRSRESWCSPPL